MTFPSNPAEYEEYCAVMNEMAEQAIASTPDPQPEDFDPEDRYLDSQWEDANEYGMEGCCGDF